MVKGKIDLYIFMLHLSPKRSEVMRVKYIYCRQSSCKKKRVEPREELVDIMPGNWEEKTIATEHRI